MGYFFQHRALRDVHNDITNEADVDCVCCCCFWFWADGMGWEVLCEIGVCVGIIIPTVRLLSLKRLRCFWKWKFEQHHMHKLIYKQLLLKYSITVLQKEFDVGCNNIKLNHRPNNSVIY